jgi:hypothetical protein
VTKLICPNSMGEAACRSLRASAGFVLLSASCAFMAGNHRACICLSNGKRLFRSFASDSAHAASSAIANARAASTSTP